jgi:hypothetical protein
MACRVAGACDHAEHAATAFAKAMAVRRSFTRRRKPEIGAAIHPRVFRQRVLVVASYS